MKLTDLESTNIAVKALKENFSMDFNLSGLDKSNTRAMLSKVKGLINESKKSPEFHVAQHSPAYLKLLFMEQALSQHIKVATSPRIVFENEEVEKSQVILAAQDMIDSVQKMYEDVNDMLVKELPALVDSIQSEIGANEGQSFDQTVSDALTQLNTALQQTQTSLKGALGGLTGQGGDAFATPTDSMGSEEEVDIDLDIDAEEPAAELPPVPDMGDDESSGMVGRAKR